MKIYSVFVFLLALVYDVVHGIQHGFDAFDIIVTCLTGVALVLNLVVLIRDRRK